MKFFLKSKRAKLDQRPDKNSILWTFAGAPPFGRFLHLCHAVLRCRPLNLQASQVEFGRSALK
jgi:hypothetical protein